MSSESSSNKLFWLAYCKAIKDTILPDPGSSNAIFFSTKAYKVPVASDLLPDEYTNYGIYNIANNMLAADNLFFVPSNANSYIRFLEKYLSYVDLGESQDDATNYKVIAAKKALDAAKINWEKEDDAAYAEFEKQEKRGGTGGLTYQQWWPTQAPSAETARKQYNGAAADYQTALGYLQGPLASQYQLDTAKITQAMNPIVETPGIAMGVCGTTAATNRELLNLINSGKTPPVPKGVYFAAEYRAPDYAYTVKDWLNQPSHGRQGQNFSFITMKTGKDVKESEFGQESYGGGLSFSYLPWISFAINGSSDHEEGLDESLLNDNEVEIKLTYDEIRSVTVTPGAWNIGNPKDAYPKLRDDAPNDVKILVAPSQLVLIKNLGYEITFSNTIKKTVDKKVKDTVQANGYIRVFGIPIKVGGDYKKSTESTSHVATWDETRGTFKVIPTDDGAFATIVATLGTKFHTT